MEFCICIYIGKMLDGISTRLFSQFLTDLRPLIDDNFVSAHYLEKY